MSQLFRFGTALVALASTAATQLLSVKRDECTNPRQVKPWGNLTTDEQQSYLNASVCLFEQPAQLGIGGAQSRWDELQYIHIYQAGWIHKVGQFLPWHRYFVAMHADILRDECDYDGPVPYWDEVSDAALSNIEDAAIFQSEAFGGNGTGTNECIADGPFANVTLHSVPGNTSNSTATANNTCIFRALSLSELQASNSTNVDACLAMTTFHDAWECIENGPHGGGHLGTGGLMSSVPNSPGDPLFFLHHAFIDLLWWRWQVQDLDTRLTAIGGNNQPNSTDICSSDGETCPTAAILDYDGDDGNTTTLNHVLWMLDIYPNVTVADVMNTNSSTVCLEYIY